MTEQDLVILEWYDSHTPAARGWIDEDQIDTRPLKLISMGAILKECKESITIAASYSDNPDCIMKDGVISIPKCAITKRKKLKYAK